MTPEERFWAKVNKTEDGCWEWTANNTRGGYGNFMPANGVARSAHRYSYEISIGPIPAGLDLDHLCRNRCCVNPDHLEPVTRSENLKRAYAARGLKTHCAQGHPFDDENTFQRSQGGRGCRTCRNKASREKKREYRAVAKAARTPQPNPERNNHD